MIRAIDYSKVNTEYYYFDGVKFQKCITLNSTKGLALDKNVEDYAKYISSDGIETLLTFAKAEKGCLYNPERVEGILNILTPNGWDSIITEDMNVRPKGLDTKDTVNISVREVLLVKVNDRVTLPIFSIDKLSLKDNFDGEVRKVPKAEIGDRVNMSKIDISTISGGDGVIVGKLIPNIYVVEDRCNMPNDNVNTIDMFDGIVITLK